ncbi:hypothetical protein EGY07_05565 [Chryseobacterium indologenes]|uniref:hypothetical protein n=2 Tax=Chryseobacterium indologenes TaxID=253 RepID=UPI000F517411|nr:hypothetical protein [Chryseobacterium indologenes]AYZ35076.1 hypothetical protein EGY07_05565 [Chryseobacterium indologenes]MBF6643825.1 hypothetical protein [Chryseobacterium indologenes]MEB4762835.1 hypothetical protein [Chryseobacterium indologenes]QQQ72445.1 hypothetical protein JHW31_06895 [Chryseobacterium indologenes]
MKKIILLLALLPSALLFSQQLTGVGFQKGENESWAINVDLSTKQNVIVSYPVLGCAGKWNLIKDEGKKILFKEVIEEGVDQCTPTGFVTLVKDEISPSAYRFYIYENKEDKTPYAIGILEGK